MEASRSETAAGSAVRQIALIHRGMPLVEIQCVAFRLESADDAVAVHEVLLRLRLLVQRAASARFAGTSGMGAGFTSPWSDRVPPTATVVAHWLHRALSPMRTGLTTAIAHRRQTCTHPDGPHGSTAGGLLRKM